jgi:hypothetical protein
MLQVELPDRPARTNEAHIGQWRISSDGLSAQEFAQLPGEIQGKNIGHWVTRVELGGRIFSGEIHRAATDEELEGKPFGAGLNASNHDATCSVEVAWMDEASRRPLTAMISGPTMMLNYPPNEWGRHGAIIPEDVLFLHQWPPMKGADWLRAVKRHRTEDLVRNTVWLTMGWVPVAGEESQAFIVGNQVIAGNDKATAATIPGVLGNVLTNAGSFGVHDVYTGPDYTDPTGKHVLADDLRELLDVWVYNSPWLDPKISVTMLAIALRPAVPLPTSVAAYFVGAPQKGKSWSARQCMSFWQGRRGVWKHTLPGSASDTFATTESAVAKTPIWVVDDLAPSTDRRASEMQESKIGDLIRAVHNKLGKRRMNPDMTERATPTPMALTIFTAENESPVQSIRERVVKVEFTGLHSENVKRADELANNTTTASRVTAALLRMYIAKGDAAGWGNVIENSRLVREDAIDSARDVLAELGVGVGDASRPAEIIADLSMGLEALQDLMGRVGMGKETKVIGWSKPEQWMYLLAEQIGLGHQNKEEVSPGQVLLTCIRELLASGRAHIANLDDPSHPPMSGQNSATTNMLMGWTMDAMGETRPQGRRIGFSAHISPKTGAGGTTDHVLFIAAEDAFREAQTAYPKKIQYGASSQTSWRNVWDLRLVHPRYANKPTKDLARQFRDTGSTAKLRGVPISFEVLFGGSPGEEIGD